jgi:hypothetical protein
VKYLGLLLNLLIFFWVLTISTSQVSLTNIFFHYMPYHFILLSLVPWNIQPSWHLSFYSLDNIFQRVDNLILMRCNNLVTFYLVIVTSNFLFIHKNTKTSDVILNPFLHQIISGDFHHIIHSGNELVRGLLAIRIHLYLFLVLLSLRSRAGQIPNYETQKYCSSEGET